MQGGKVVGLLDGTALATEAQRAVARGAGREGRRHAPDASIPPQANERFDHKERQKAKSLGLLVQRSRQREPAAEEEEERRL